MSHALNTVIFACGLLRSVVADSCDSESAECVAHEMEAAEVTRTQTNLIQNQANIGIKLDSAPSALTLKAIAAQNRKIRNQVKEWITPSTIDNSVLDYGMLDPHRKAVQMALDTGPAPAQPDFVSLLGARLVASGQPVNYLEIGVSVMKTIHTQSHAWADATITALDIEDPNPTIESKWKHKTTLASWTETTVEDDLRRNKGRSTDYVYKYEGPNNNVMYYVTGNEFNDHTWDHLYKHVVSPSGAVNLVLSDAMHEAAAVTTEMERLLAQGIVKNEVGKDFAMVWDDCSTEHIAEAFDTKIVPSLRKTFSGRKTCAAKFNILGWVGKNGGSHSTCLFTTLCMGSGDGCNDGLQGLTELDYMSPVVCE